MCTNRRIDFVHDAEAPARGRHFAVAAVSELCPGAPPHLTQDAELVVSELVTNSFHAGAGRIRLEIESHDDNVTIGVTDDAAGDPVLRHPGVTATGGRGLAIVEVLAQSWGVERSGRGKRVWVRLGHPSVPGRCVTG